jgi:hypothetical protein
MSREQIETIAQKHVNEVLAEINEKVEREKERIEQERIERETKLREKQHEKELARERAAEEKAEKERIKAEQREQKAEEKRLKQEAKDAERKRKADEKAAQKELKTTQKVLVMGEEGIVEHDVQKGKEAEIPPQKEGSAKDEELDETQGDHAPARPDITQDDEEEKFEDAVAEVEDLPKEEDIKDGQTDEGQALDKTGTDDDFEQIQKEEAIATSGPSQSQIEPVPHPDTSQEDDTKRGKIKSWLLDKKEKIGRRLSRAPETTPSKPTPIIPTQAIETEPHEPAEDRNEAEGDRDWEEEDIYGAQPPKPPTKWLETPGEPGVRESSMREVAMATSDDTEPERSQSREESTFEYFKVKEPVQTSDETNDGSGYQHKISSPVHQNDRGFSDAAEDLSESKKSLSVKEEGRKVSSERGSRFREEF